MPILLRVSLNERKRVISRERRRILLYRSPDNRTRIDVRLDGETVWLSQAQMAELFQTTKQNISHHVRNVFDEKELDATSTVKQYLTVQTEGGRGLERRGVLRGADRAGLQVGRADLPGRPAEPSCSANVLIRAKEHAGAGAARVGVLALLAFNDLRAESEEPQSARRLFAG
jgi:hypothetical protein